MIGKCYVFLQKCGEKCIIFNLIILWVYVRNNILTLIGPNVNISGYKMNKLSPLEVLKFKLR